MAFKLRSHPSKRILKKAKKLIRKSVGNTTVDSPTYNPNLSNKKFDKQIKRNIKADKLLHKLGYNLEEREQATGAGGYKEAMKFAKKTKKNKKK